MRTLPTLALALVSTRAFAAEPLTWGETRVGEVSGIGTWATGLAIGDSYEFTPKYGFIGFNGEVMVHPRADVSVGLTSGYQLFLGQERSTVEAGDAALDAFQFRYLDTVPILAVGRYYVELSPIVSFFPALGIGTIYTNRVVDVGIVALYDDFWHFGVAPQVGLLFHTDGPDPVVDVKYNVAVGGSESPTEMWFTAEVGLLFD
jgi:hypothetical protein